MQVIINGQEHTFTFRSLGGNVLTLDSAKHRFNPWILRPDYECLALRHLALYLGGHEKTHKVVWWEYTSQGYAQADLLYAYLVHNSVKIRTARLKRLLQSTTVYRVHTDPILTEESLGSKLYTTIERLGLPLIEFDTWGEQPSIQEYLDEIRTTRPRDNDDSIA